MSRNIVAYVTQPCTVKHAIQMWIMFVKPRYDLEFLFSFNGSSTGVGYPNIV